LVNQKNINCAFISLDQEKAFDKIVHKFLFKVLEKFNFGPKLIKWIKILYHDLNSCIIVNNFIHAPNHKPFVLFLFNFEPDALPNKFIKYKNFLIP
jgi:hypothetical protein